jgi:hypothetical protein
MATNHKWNMLNIMRFYTRIGKEFNADVYIDFVSPHEGANTKGKGVPTRSQALLIIRRYLENGWCIRVGKNVVITDKGIAALMAYEKTKYIKEAQVSNETLRRRELARD